MRCWSWGVLLLVLSQPAELHGGRHCPGGPSSLLHASSEHGPYYYIQCSSCGRRALMPFCLLFFSL